MIKLKFYFLIFTIHVTGIFAVSLSTTAVKTPLKKMRYSVCQRFDIDRLFARKKKTYEKLQSSIRSLNEDKMISQRTRIHRLKVLNVMQREMNDSAKQFFQSIDNLKTLLRGNYESILELKQTSKIRLDQLRNAMVQAEDEYNVIIEEERKEEIANKISRPFKTGKETMIRDYINNLFMDISSAADTLQDRLDDASFEHEIHDGGKIEIETVIKVGGKESEGIGDNEGVVMLVDSESNHFVLSKPNDNTITHVDHVLLKEIMCLVMVAFVFMLVCNLLKLPSIFAPVLAGVILGPAGAGYIKSIVQIETIGEFGVFFFLFTVGTELSPAKLSKVLRQSLIGTVSILVCSIVIGLFLGSLFGILPKQSIFVAVCLTFCSTPMMTSIIQEYSTKDHDAVSSTHTADDYMNLLLSMLVLQDLGLGIFMAVLPILAGHAVEHHHPFTHVPGNVALHSWFHGKFGGVVEEIFFTTIEIVLALIGIMLVTYVITRYIAKGYFRSLNLFGTHHQSFVLGILTGIFSVLTITEMLGVSMELGGFISGAIVSTMGEQSIKQVTQIIRPFKDFFSVLFFASIGFHVFPSFVLSEIAIFIPITGLVVLTKFLVAFLVLHQLLPKGSNSKWLVAIGLSQMSELSFVLGSRARRSGLIGREVYLVILSVTTLSLLCSPFIWKSVHSSVTQTGKWSIHAIVQKLRSLPR